MKKIGGHEDIAAPADARQELEKLGHLEFTAFHGHNLLGYDKELDIATKLMYCPDIDIPCLVELEKTALNPAAAQQRQAELVWLVRQFDLEKRLVRDEPPTLIYNKLFKKGNR